MIRLVSIATWVKYIKFKFLDIFLSAEVVWSTQHAKITIENKCVIININSDCLLQDKYIKYARAIPVCHRLVIVTLQIKFANAYCLENWMTCPSSIGLYAVPEWSNLLFNNWNYIETNSLRNRLLMFHLRVLPNAFEYIWESVCSFLCRLLYSMVWRIQKRDFGGKCQKGI